MRESYTAYLEDKIIRQADELTNLNKVILRLRKHCTRVQQELDVLWRSRKAIDGLSLEAIRVLANVIGHTNDTENVAQIAKRAAKLIAERCSDKNQSESTRLNLWEAQRDRDDMRRERDEARQDLIECRKARRSKNRYLHACKRMHGAWKEANREIKRLKEERDAFLRARFSNADYLSVKNALVRADRAEEYAARRIEQSESSEALREALAANEKDRTTVSRVAKSIHQILRGYGWATEGRGPYHYDDDEYQQEFGRCLEEIKKALAPLDYIGADLTNCPTTQAEVWRARESESRSDCATQATPEITCEQRLESAKQFKNSIGDFATRNAVASLIWAIEQLRKESGQK